MARLLFSLPKPMGPACRRTGVCCRDHSQDRGNNQSLGSAWAALNTTKKRKEKDNFYLVDVHLG